MQRELYTHWKVGLGLEDQKNTNLVDSPDAKFRRGQILKYKESGFSTEDAHTYGEQIGARANQ